MNHPKNRSLRTPAVSKIRYESFRHWPNNLADNEIINEFLFTIENPPNNRVALSFTCCRFCFILLISKLSMASKKVNGATYIRNTYRSRGTIRKSYEN